MPVVIGTSGWQYRHWRPSFYPPSLPTARWLEYYARRFATVEVNSSFYRLPSPSTVEKWRDTVPGDFVMAVKASRYLTHVRRLREPSEPVTRLLGRVGPLGTALGPVLLQLPPDFAADVPALDATLRALGSAVKVAVEFRHPSWFAPGTREVLERHDAALCLVDVQGPREPRWRTASWGYVRFHQGEANRSQAMARTSCAGGPRRWPSSGPTMRRSSPTSTTTRVGARHATPSAWPWPSGTSGGR